MYIGYLRNGRRLTHCKVVKFNSAVTELMALDLSPIVHSARYQGRISFCMADIRVCWVVESRLISIRRVACLTSKVRYDTNG